jgi:hypothetical protein
MKRKILLVFLAVLALPLAGLRAQELIIPEGFDVVDSLVYRPATAVDSTLVGRSVFSMVEVNQPASVATAMDSHIANNRAKAMTGYRVRIFFDNKQNARQMSEQVQRSFEASHPGIVAHRSFASPFFKVTVGDFRTKSEAMQLLQQISREYSSAFVVKENIDYPPVDREHSYVVDTVLVLRPTGTR